MILALTFLILDRITKILSLKHFLAFYPNHSLYFFNLPSSVIVITSIIIIVTLTFFLLKSWHKPSIKNALLLIILGGSSNLFDRLLYGFVIDWIQTPISVLNLADISITLGCLLFALNSPNYRTNQSVNISST